MNEDIKDNIKQAEQREEFLSIIYNNVCEAIFVADRAADGTFYYQDFNPAAKELTGIEDIIDKTPEDIFPPEVADRVTQNYQRCVDLKTIISYEECLPFKGEDSWWLTTLNPVKDETGNIYRVVGTALNITDRKTVELELDREKKFLETLIDNLSEGIIVCDRNGILTHFNRATIEIHGLPKEEISPCKWAQYFEFYYADGKTLMDWQDIPLSKALQGKSIRDVEMKIIPKQQEPRTIIVNGDPIINSQGEKIGALVSLRDISEREQGEKVLAELNGKLSELNKQLEVRVKQRTEELERANELLLDSNRELEQFAYVASHDLKAPLRAISNLSEWIEEDLADKLDEETRHNMNLLRNRVHRLENLINSLLAYSRITKLIHKPQTVIVDKLLEEIIDSLEVPANFNITINGEMPTLITEKTLIDRVFSNLISNAIKHSNSDRGKVIISVVEKDYFYEFSVRDNGPGIDPKYHEKIFAIFQTLEPRDTKESTGIGLAIVKKAVEKQGGTVKVESRLGNGTTFKFTWNKIGSIK